MIFYEEGGGGGWGTQAHLLRIQVSFARVNNVVEEVKLLWWPGFSFNFLFDG